MLSTKEKPYAAAGHNISMQNPGKVTVETQMTILNILGFYSTCCSDWAVPLSWRICWEDFFS